MWEQIRANQRKAFILVGVMAFILIFLGYFLGIYFTGNGSAGLVVAVIVWIILTLISYFGGQSILLALSGARQIGPNDHPVLYHVVEEMKIAAGLPTMPAIYVIDDPAPNAFATGRKPDVSAIAVTSGLLETLSRDELQGVVAHETAHIKNRDVLYMMMVGIMAGAIVLLADISRRYLLWGGGRSRRRTSRGSGQAGAIIMVAGLILMILAPILAQLIYFAVSRRKEYLADACGALYTRYPEGLARALEKIAGKPLLLRSANRATAPMYIINPLKLTANGLANLSSTHPPISQRIKILRSMAGGVGFSHYDQAFRLVTGRPVGVIPFSSLNQSEALASRPKSSPAPDAATPLQRMRQTTDMLWRLNQFFFIACPCGTKLKIPPVYAGKVIECPHCHTPHHVPDRISAE